MTTRSDAPRLSLFRKYFLAFFIAVTVPLLANGASESWFGYHDYRATLYARLKIEAAAAASEIRGFLDGIRDQMGWAVQLPWTMDNTEAHRLDAWRLLRQIPAIVEFALVDGEGIERVRVSRIGQDEIDSGINRSDDPAVVGARTHRVWYGPVTLNRGSEPYMTLSVASNRSSVGVAIAQVNLTLIWNAISAIRVGNNGLAFVLDSNAKLVAHPDLNRMLQGIDEVTNVRLRGVREAILASGGEPVTGEDFEGRAVIAAAAPVAGVDWLVVAEQPTSEAFAPIRAALQRTGLLLLGGSVLALALAYLLAGRMIRPIRLLKEGAAQIGAGRFHHKIDIATGDELELLADQFKQMAGELAVSHERSERIARLKRFLSPQVADIVERSEDGNLLDARRADVVVVFGDLRGFTNFSATTEPDEIMRVLAQYYEAVGENITRYEATLTHFAGDGLMILLNAPVPCADNPVLRAIRMAGSMQTSIQALIVKWRARGQPMGFGIGFAKGVATVGRVGYEGRHDYTAIGNVVNLASRLCAAAEDGQILLDPIAADDVAGAVSLNPLGKHTLKGFTEPIAVYAVARQGRVDDASTPPVGQLLP